MRTFLLAATMLSLAASGVHAQVAVYDAPGYIKSAATAISTAQTVENTGKELAGMVHGNGFGSLLPGLTTGIAANPLGADAASAASMMSGVNSGGGMSGLFNRFLGQTQTFQPTGNDPEALMMTQRASAAAGQMAVAQQFLNGSSSRMSMLPQLFNAVTGTADIKDAMDANTRVNAEATTQGAHANQLQALALYQQAEANAQRSREELAWRKSAETQSALAEQAATNAANGQVNLITQ